MPLLSLSRVINNLIVLGVLFAIGFMIYSKMDKARVKDTIEKLRGLFGGKKE